MPRALAVSTLTDLVRAIEPKTAAHMGFVCVEDGTGPSVALESTSGFRLFDLRTESVAADDGESGRSSLRKSITLRLRVRYDLAAVGDRRLLENIIDEDADSIADALFSDVAGWNGGTTGIDTVDAPIPQSIEPVLDDDAEAEVAVIAPSLVGVRYHETV